MSKKSRSKRAIQQGRDAVQPANETEGRTINTNDIINLSSNQERGKR